LISCDENPDVRAIVLTGAGKAFSSGYDLDADLFNKEWPRASDKLGLWWKIARTEVTYRWRLMEIGKPVIAAIRGWCLGGGFWYSLFADITIAAESATFGQPEIRENQDATFLFAALCGWKVALRYTLTGD